MISGHVDWWHTEGSPNLPNIEIVAFLTMSQEFVEALKGIVFEETEKGNYLLVWLDILPAVVFSVV